MQSPWRKKAVDHTQMSDQRKHASNIGIRRRHGPRLRDVRVIAEEENLTGPHSNAGAQRNPAPAGAIGSRLQILRRQALARSAHSSRIQKISDFEGESDKENQTPLASGGTGHSGTDRGGESPPVLLTSPDVYILPVAKTEQAKSAFDFYINSFVTSIIEVAPENIAPYSQMVHQILHDELLFTAFTTCSEAARWRTQTLYDDVPPNVVKGYGKTLSLLAQKLQSERFAMSPTALLTMGQLVAIETLTKNVSATARHLAGMRAAMKPKGDTPAKGTQPVQDAVDVWSQYFMHRAMVKATVIRSEPPTYPKHPFSSTLIDQVAELPTGFSDVALSGRLCIQMLNLLQHFNGYFNTINKQNAEGIFDSPERTENILRQAAYCLEYHQIRQLTVIERFVLLALTAYVVRRDRVHPALVNIRTYFQITCAYQSTLLSTSTHNLLRQDQGSSLLNWVGLILLLTSTPEAYARKLALTILPKKPELMKMLKNCQNFYWDEDLTNALLSGKVLATAASNDIIGDNIKQASPKSED